MKKPLRRDFLDFTTLEARRRNCEEELRLNRRLAPDVYIGTVPLALDGAGLRLGRADVIVDWLVQMVRLPEERMLDRALAAGAVGPEDIRRIAVKLAAFYAIAPRADFTTEQYREVVCTVFWVSTRLLIQVNSPPSLRV